VVALIGYCEHLTNVCKLCLNIGKSKRSINGKNGMQLLRKVSYGGLRSEVIIGRVIFVGAGWPRYIFSRRFAKVPQKC